MKIFTLFLISFSLCMTTSCQNRSTTSSAVKGNKKTRTNAKPTSGYCVGKGFRHEYTSSASFNFVNCNGKHYLSKRGSYNKKINGEREFVVRFKSELKSKNYEFVGIYHNGSIAVIASAGTFTAKTACLYTRNVYPTWTEHAIDCNDGAGTIKFEKEKTYKTYISGKNFGEKISLGKATPFGNITSRSGTSYHYLMLPSK